ncbi:MAG: TatD family nuclease-associated radical SAM protein [Endomicrobiales bacterium]
MTNSLVYRYQDSLYVNLTNRCLMACTYCIKYKWKGKFRGHDLRLEKEPAARQVIKAIGDPKKYREVIFCGYGEPLLRLKTLKEIAAWVKENGGRVRINTSGAANLYYERNIVPELKGLVDAISISLNASSARQYVEQNRPRHGEKTFKAVIDFARESRKHIPEVTITTVALPGVDIEKCRRIAERLKVHFRVRPYLDEYEVS